MKKFDPVTSAFLLVMMALFPAFAQSPAKAQSSAKIQAPVEIQLVTQSFAPLQYQVEGRASGYVIETLDRIARQLAEDGAIRFRPVQFLPWKRAMEIAKTQPNILFFSLSRTNERESWFHWIGEISPYGQNFYKLKSRTAITASELKDLANTHYRIGVQSGSSLLRLMEKMKLTDSNIITSYTDYHQGVKMLYADRLDMIPLTGFLARSSACGMGFDGDRLEPVLPISELAKPLWLVMSRSTEETVVRQVRHALDGLKASGDQDRIIGKYLKQWASKPCTAN